MEKRKLIEMGTLSRGRSQHRPRNDSKLYGGKYPFIQTGDVKNSNLYIEKYSQTYNDFGLNQSKLWPENTLCITIAANIADTGILSFPACFPDSIIGFTATKGKTDVRYVKYCFDLLQKSIQNMSKGSTQDNLSMEKLEQLEFNCPSFENQQKIAAVLSSLDDKIALNNRINAKLEQMAKRLYDYWFVQFDFPVSCHSELVSESHSDEMLNQVQHDECAKPYKSTGGKMVWNETLKREIPDGWEVKKISEILDCEIPGDWGEEEIKGNHKYKVNCIRGCDMVDMTDLPVRYILESNSKKLLQKDDFVIEISGGSPTQSTGRIVQITDEIIKRFNGKIICSNFCHGIRLNDKDYASYFFQMWNMFYLNNIFFNYEGKTSGLKNFQFDTFVSETWYVPPKELVRKYHEVVSKFRKQIDINESETQKFTVLRDRLLPLLMNGQVEVK